MTPLAIFVQLGYQFRQGPEAVVLLGPCSARGCWEPPGLHPAMPRGPWDTRNQTQAYACPLENSVNGGIEVPSSFFFLLSQNTVSGVGSRPEAARG